jgi:carbamoyl-phosphate synthase large subunit
MKPCTKAPAYRVVVTGVGAIIGQGIIKALRRAPYAVRIVGVDRNPDAVGAHLCDRFYCKPQCAETEGGYRDFWLSMAGEEGVDLILPGIEIDVFYLDMQRRWFEAQRVRLCLNGAPLIGLARDKWALGQELQKLGMFHIPGVIDGDWESCVRTLGPPPLLMKPRRGSGSRGIMRLYDADDFAYWRRKAGDNFMVQRIVGSDDEEYTVGSFGFGDGTAVAPIVFRRRLSAAGNTQSAEVVQDRSIEDAVARLNSVFHPLGPTNYQFRREGETLFLLEVNPRFSSTTSLRAAFGYNEPCMAIEFYLEGRKPARPVIQSGRAFRYTEEFVQKT